MNIEIFNFVHREGRSSVIRDSNFYETGPMFESQCGKNKVETCMDR